MGKFRGPTQINSDAESEETSFELWTVPIEDIDPTLEPPDQQKKAQPFESTSEPEPASLVSSSVQIEGAAQPDASQEKMEPILNAKRKPRAKQNVRQ